MIKKTIFTIFVLFLILSLNSLVFAEISSAPQDTEITTPQSEYNPTHDSYKEGLVIGLILIIPFVVSLIFAISKIKSFKERKRQVKYGWLAILIGSILAIILYSLAYLLGIGPSPFVFVSVILGLALPFFGGLASDTLFQCNFKSDPCFGPFSIGSIIGSIILLGIYFLIGYFIGSIIEKRKYNK